MVISDRIACSASKDGLLVGHVQRFIRIICRVAVLEYGSEGGQFRQSYL